MQLIVSAWEGNDTAACKGVMSPPFTRCRARAQVDHLLRHAGELVPFCPGSASGWLCDWFCFVFRLTNFALRVCFHIWILCSIFYVLSFYNKNDKYSLCDKLLENPAKRRRTRQEVERERERERERVLFATALQAYHKGYKPIYAGAHIK